MNRQQWGSFSMRLCLQGLNSTRVSISLLTRNPSNRASKIKGPGPLLHPLPTFQASQIPAN